MDDLRFASNAYANAGTRILVQTIMEFLGAGDSIEEILEEYRKICRSLQDRNKCSVTRS